MTDQVHLTASVDLDATPERPSVSILALTGSPVKTARHGTLVIDLEGVQVADTTPLLRNHDDAAVLGIVTDHRIDDSGLHVEASVTGDDEHSRDVLTHSRNGFPWRASVGIDLTEKQMLPRGQRKYINGRHVSGPATIAKRSEVFEVSLVSLPADRDTRATIRASKDQIMTDIVEAEDRDPVELERERLEAIDDIRDRYLSDPLQTNRLAIEERLQRAVGDGSDPKEVEIDVLHMTRDYKINNRIPQHYGGVSGSDHVTLSLMCQSGFAEHAAKQYGEAAVEQAVRRPVRLSQLFDRDTARLSSGFSTANVSNILADTANKISAGVYEESKPTWERFASIKIASDYRPHHALRLSNLQRLEPVGRGGEIRHSQLGDQDYPFKVDIYAQLLSLTEEDIVNDDLGAFSDILPSMARAARATVDDLVYKVIADATAGSHWSEAHGNKLEAGSALDADSLGSAITLIRRQTHPNGSTLALAPRVLVVPPELEFTARALLSSTEVLGTDGPAGNPLKGIVGLEVEPRISDPEWFLFSGPEATGMIVAYLNGQRQPRVEAEPADFNQLGMRFRVSHRFGAAMADHRASVFATGAGE